MLLSRRIVFSVPLTQRLFNQTQSSRRRCTWHIQDSRNEFAALLHIEIEWWDGTDQVLSSVIIIDTFFLQFPLLTSFPCYVSHLISLSPSLLSPLFPILNPFLKRDPQNRSRHVMVHILELMAFCPYLVVKNTCGVRICYTGRWSNGCMKFCASLDPPLDMIVM